MAICVHNVPITVFEVANQLEHNYVIMVTSSFTPSAESCAWQLPGQKSGNFHLPRGVRISAAHDSSFFSSQQ